MISTIGTALRFHHSLIIKLLATSAICLCGSAINNSGLYHRVWVGSALTHHCIFIVISVNELLQYTYAFGLVTLIIVTYFSDYLNYYHTKLFELLRLFQPDFVFLL
jgi:hypothetical protein